MNSNWYCSRFMSMPWGEVVWRLRRLGWQITSRLTRRIRAARYQRESIDGPNSAEIFDRVSFYGLKDITSADVPKSCIQNTVATAEKLLEHRCNIFALQAVDLGEKINWNYEYKRNIKLPLHFAPWMNYRDTEAYGDFKYFWELSRWQHLITLAKAYYLTDENKFANAVVRQMNDFMKECPYLLGVNWIMPMEASIRLISLCWIAAFLRKYLKQNLRTTPLIQAMVRSHIDFITKNYSRYSSANNHLIAEATCVFLSSICFKNISELAEHGREAYDILCREITHQFLQDGVNQEQSTHYHISCYICFLLAALLGKANGFDFPAEYWRTLENATCFIYAIANKDHSIPHIGDSDDGKSVLLTDSDSHEVRSLLATAAVLFDRTDFKAKARDFDEMSFWLLGKEGKRMFDSLPAICESAPESVFFPYGGYYIMKSTDPVPAKLVFDCGPLGMGTIAAHGHADALSLQLCVCDREFFIDPGTYTFVKSDPYRNYFRSTAAHNTLTVDGEDQSMMAGPFLWTHKAHSHVKEWIDDGKRIKVTGWHDGYKRLNDPVVHQRSVEFHKNRGQISIEDSIEAKSFHEVCQYFHLAPECKVVGVGDNLWEINNAGKVVRLNIDRRFTCEIIRGCEKPICGWVSKSYDEKAPTNTLVCRFLSQGSQIFSTKIIL